MHADNTPGMQWFAAGQQYQMGLDGFKQSPSCSANLAVEKRGGKNLTHQKPQTTNLLHMMFQLQTMTVIIIMNKP